MSNPKRPEFTMEDVDAAAEIGAMLGLDQVVDDPDAVDAAELAKRYGFSTNSVTGRLQKLVEEGKLEIVRKRKLCSNGSVRIVNAYRRPKHAAA